MSKEAMTLALEALLRIENSLVYSQPINGDVVDEAIKAIEEALAKQEQGEPDDEVLGFNGWGFPIEHPPKLKREPLTDDELKPHIEIAMKYYGYDSTKYGLTATSGFVWLARAIEAAHGIKENT